MSLLQFDCKNAEIIGKKNSLLPVTKKRLCDLSRLKERKKKKKVQQKPSTSINMI